MNRTEIAATALGWDVADLRQNRYQSTRTPIPVWTAGDDYITVATDAELARLKKAGFEDYTWSPIADSYAQSLAQKMSPPRKVWGGRV